MENASKALLIAASILIVILLIAFGMRIFNSTSGTAGSVDETMNATQIATFNNKFLAYVGENKSVAQVKALANLVIANNATSEKDVTLAGRSSTQDITDYVASLSGSVDISVSDINNDGFIDTITIN